MLPKEGVGGKFLKIIKDMYAKSKSCVFVDGQKSDYFSSQAGVRQGEILSPLLFAFYINDLEQYLKSKNISSLDSLKIISGDSQTLCSSDLDLYLDLLTLYYADDTIILSETSSGLQAALNELFNYCNESKLTVNEDKTKIMCIPRKETRDLKFYYNGKELEIVEEFTYLGVKFTNKGISKETVLARIIPSQKSMFATLSNCKASNIPIDLVIELFDKIVMPCMLYGGEVFGFKNIAVLERLQLKYAKYALNLKSSTPTCMIYGETGYLPVEYYVKIKMINFWIFLISSRQDKLSFKLYNICLLLYKQNSLKFEWLAFIEKTINECGQSMVFREHLNLDSEFLKKVFLPNIKSILQNQYIQKWQTDVQNCSKCLYYQHFNFKPYLQKYLKKLPPDIWIPIVKLRTANHRLPIEIYSWDLLYKDRDKRLCTICNLGDVGDEYHYVMLCPVFKEAREEFLTKYFRNKPSVFKYIELVNSTNFKVLRGLARFLNILFSIFQ